MIHAARTRSLPILIGSLFVFSGCVSGPILRRNNATPPSEARTELMLLNVNEASGWVAYAAAEGSNAELEEYRIVVIRARNGELIYDSTVPLASDLRTHGFEMDANDPRLRRMADSVDRNVIAPLEAFQKSLPVPVPAPAPAPAPTPPPPSPAPAAKTPAAAVDSAPAAPSLPFAIDTIAEKAITLRLQREDAVQMGQRFFVRTPDRLIRLPGFDEDVVSPGEVVGLVEISSLDGLRAAATLVSGEIPANALLEPAAAE